MKIISSIIQPAVWQHWMTVEKYADPNFRSDIRNPLPDDILWFRAEIEEGDLDKLYIISSADWTGITGNTFKVLEAAKHECSDSDDKHTQRLSSDINRKIEFINSGGPLDRVLFVVAPSFNGPFTLIEGNRRSVVFTIMNTIVGCPVFLGFSPDIEKYKWARLTTSKYK